MTYSKDGILSQLDNCAGIYDFPMLNNMYFYKANLRMKVFRNSQEWLIFIAELAFSIKERLFVNLIYSYGNKVEKPGLIWPYEIIAPVLSEPFFNDDGSTFLLDIKNFEVMINNQVRNFHFNDSDYINARIDPNDIDMPNEAKIIRILSHHLSDELFYNNQQLLEVAKKSNNHLELFLELNDWQHPDLAEDELPSDIPCFQKLAESIVVGNPKLYHCPEEMYNTHWSNWEWYREDC